MVSLTGVTKRFGSSVAVDDISFTVEAGETLVLLGTSGCGKTTTLRMINKLIEADSGSITVNGKPIAGVAADELRKGIGYVMQQAGLFPHYTVEQNIGIVPSLLKWPAERTRKRVFELMEQLHLPPAEYGAKYASELSGGQQQRVGLARALAGNAPVLLMDEPFGALDPVTRLRVRRDFLQLEAAAQKTILLVTHDIEEAVAMGHRVCLMDKGRIVQLGTPRELLFKPANGFVQHFFDGDRTRLELQLIAIRDLWQWLPANSQLTYEQEAAAAPFKKWSVDNSCWEVLTALTTLSDAVDFIEVLYKGEVKRVDNTNLLGAIGRFKQSIYSN